MARPRVFISSTYYDLRHIRASLEAFVDSLGYDPVLSEKGSIAYHPDLPLDESCYKEASSADIFVLIIGGRYGSEASSDGGIKQREFYERYDSITAKEYESAELSGVPIYILIESHVYAEYKTFSKNKERSDINYAHVDSANVFRLIDGVMRKLRNNPVFYFEKSSQIEFWLREQWAGLFRELLRSRSQRQQLSALSDQVRDLKSVNDTLKSYLEAIIKFNEPDKSNTIIEKENTRIKKRKFRELFKDSSIFETLDLFSSIDDEIIDKIEDIVLKSSTYDEIISRIGNLNKEYLYAFDARYGEHVVMRNIIEINNIRTELSEAPLIQKDLEHIKPRKGRQSP